MSIKKTAIISGVSGSTGMATVLGSILASGASVAGPASNLGGYVVGAKTLGPLVGGAARASSILASVGGPVGAVLFGSLGAGLVAALVGGIASAVLDRK